MLHYPKIPSSQGCPGGRCVAFDKLDGTNLHFVWDRDFGWHAFGTRRDRFDLTPLGIESFHRVHPGLEGCESIFHSILACELERLFRERADYSRFVEIVAFTEFVGANSFAGQHAANEPKELVLFDVLAGESGWVSPEAFVRDFGEMRIPRVVFRGKFSGKLTEDVRQGKYGVEEGVVIKGGEGDRLWMCKVKTRAYLERLKRLFGARWEDYWE